MTGSDLTLGTGVAAPAASRGGGVSAPPLGPPAAVVVNDDDRGEQEESGGGGARGREKRRRHHPIRSVRPCPRKKKSKRARRRRMAELERSAALRCLSGNGCDPDLPPLPAGVDAASASASPTATATARGGGGGHPYGVLPHGNVFASARGDRVRRLGLGSLGVLNDEQVLSILGYLDGPDLGGGVVLCGRFLYAAGHARVDLWRDLTLRLLEGDRFDRFEGGGWRDTYVSYWLERRGGGRRSGGRPMKDEDTTGDNRHAEDGSSSIAPPRRYSHSHAPIRISGVYSDALYRPWFCSSFSPPKSWLRVDNVARVHVSNITTSDFLSRYERPNIPCVVEGATEGWPALQKWNRQYLLKLAGASATFRATSGAAPLPASFTLGGYFDYCSASSRTREEESPLYLFDRTFAASVPQLLRDYSYALSETVPFLSPDAGHGHDLFGLLGGRRRPDFRWLIVGPRSGSGSAFHIDPNCTHAWNVPVRGRKRWIFYPPGMTPPGVVPSANGDEVALPVSIGEWHLSFWDEHVRRRDHPDPRKRPIECTVAPGDLLFVPHGWWHTVLNLDDDDDDGDGGDYSIALTQNYVSSTNLPDVLRFLRTKQNQISGCRDRAGSDGAVGPGELYGEFVAAMGERRPELLREAEAIAAGGWTCDAWTDDAAGAGAGAECSDPSRPMDEKQEEEGKGGACGEACAPTRGGASSHTSGVASAGTSVLSRAKMYRSEGGDASLSNANGCKGASAGRSSEGAGFSFSFI